MKRVSIFRQMIKVNLIAIIAGSVVIGFSFYLFLTDYTYNTKIQTLRQNIYQIIEYVDYQSTYNQSVSSRVFRRDLSLIAQSLQSHIFIMNTSGFVVSTSISELEYTQLDVHQFKNALDGHETIINGVIEGLPDYSLLSLVAPIKTVNNTVIGLVMISSPIPSINQMAYDVLLRLFMSLCIASVLTLALTYALSKRISKPIKDIATAAKSITKGRFSKVSYSRNDEIGDLAQTFNYMSASVQNNEQARKTFISNVSHDLRTPITTISGFIDGILDGTIPPEKYAKYLKVASDSAKRMSSLITSFLDLSKLDENKIPLKKTSFDINEVLCSTLLSFEQHIKEKNIEVSVSIPNAKCIVYADKDYIIRVLVNLLENAVKFTEESGNISVNVNPSSPARVTISNTGKGIDSADLQFIWDRFYKTEKSRGDNTTGSGLGLYIVKSIINMHNESITATSEKGITSFEFTLSREN